MFQQMTTFVRIADMGSITRAARSLGLSLPMASRHLRWLEQELGTPLVHRTTRQLHLTDAGQSYLDAIESERARIGIPRGETAVVDAHGLPLEVHSRHARLNPTFDVGREKTANAEPERVIGFILQEWM